MITLTYKERNSVMLKKMFHVVGFVNLMEVFAERQITSWAIYIELRSRYSKASVYRYLRQAEERGFIVNVSDNEHYDWRATKRGLEFVKSQEKLEV